MQNYASTRPDAPRRGESISETEADAITTQQRDQLVAERRDLQHWLRLITAKRDLIAARVVPPVSGLEALVELEPQSGGGEGSSAAPACLAEVLGLHAPLPSTREILLLQCYASKTSQRIAELDDQIQAW